MIGEVTLFGEEEFTVQAATKSEIPISQAPGSVTVISAQQIRESAARTIPELLRMVAGVNVRWNPMVQSVDIRGFGQTPFTSRVLLLIDGVPYNSWNKGGFPQHPGFDFFVLQNVKQIEIVRGPGSSLYGENAYWGVINILTLSGDDLQGGQAEIFVGDVETRSAGAVYGLKSKRGSFLVSGKYTESQLLPQFWSREQNSIAEGADLFFKWSYEGLQLSYYRHEDQIDGFSRPIAGGTFASAEKVEQTVDIFAAKYNRKTDSGALSFGGDLSYAQRDGMRCASCHAFAQNKEAYSATADHGFQLIGDFRVGMHQLRHHDFLVGVEARSVDTGNHKEELLQPDATEEKVVYDYTKLAAYAQDQISLANEKVRLILGARYDGSNDLFDDEVSPRVATVWTATDALVLRAGWGSSFRFPNFSELYQNSGFLTVDRGFPLLLSRFIPNPGLKPEQLTTFELGGEYRFTPGLSAKLDLYHSEVEDFVVISNAQGGIHFENHPDKASVEGLELEMRFNVERRVTGFVNWSHQRTEQDGLLTDSAGKLFEFVYAPDNKINVGSYFGPFAGFRGSIEASWKDETLGPSSWNEIITRNTPNPQTGVGVLDAYTLLNVRLSYEFPIGRGKPLRLSVLGKDLLDEEPAETLIPFDMRLPGRQIYGSVDFGF